LFACSCLDPVSIKKQAELYIESRHLVDVTGRDIETAFIEALGTAGDGVMGAINPV
jgi:hypothetical protein